MKRLLAFFLSLVLWCGLFPPLAAQAAVVVSEPTTEVASTSNVTSYAMTAFTPSANSVLILFVGASDTLATGSVTGGSLTWTKIGSTTLGGADTLYLFRAATGASPASTTVTFDCTGDAASGALMQVYQVTGANTSSPIVQSKFSAAGGVTGTNATVSLTSAAVTTSAIIAAHFNTLTAPMSTAPTGFTEGNFDDTYNTPRHSMAGAYKATGFTSQAITFTSASSTYAIAAVEVAVMTTGGGAGVQEICGNGYDDDSTGGDASCGTPDSDRDGYVDSEDCAPNDRTIYAGVRVTCGTDGTKLCNATGSYSACVEGELDESTGSGNAYYVNPSTGSDGANCLTRATACATLAPFSEGGAKALAAGDVLYLMSGTIDSAINTTCSGVRSALCISGTAGTAANPVVIKAYPGQTPTITLSGCNSKANHCKAIYAFSGANYVTVGPKITFRDFFGAAYKGDFSDFNRVTGNTIRDLDGETNNNQTGIDLQTMIDFEVDHNDVFDVYDRTNISYPNNVQITAFRGSGRIHHNLVHTSFAAATAPGCIKYKHADYGTANGKGRFDPVCTGDVEIDNNILWNCGTFSHGSIGSGQANSHIHHNLLVNSAWITHDDLGGDTCSLGNLIEYNTVLGRALHYDPVATYAAIGSFAYQRNVIQDSETSYPQESKFIEIGTYGSDVDYNNTVPSNLTLANNCYRNTLGTALSFGLFEGSPGTTGATYAGLTAWKAAFTSNDTGSVQMSSNVAAETFAPADASCLLMGHLANWVSETGSTQSGGSSTTTSTSTTTTSALTTTTLLTDAGADRHGFRHGRSGR